MSEKETVVSGVAGRYAAALFELASEQDEVDAVAGDLDRFEAMLAESDDLRRLVRSPVFTPDDQLKAVGAVLDKAGIVGLVASFVRLAAKNRRLFAVPSMIRGFRRLVAAYRGETTADVTSAHPLSAEHEAALKEALKGAAGGKTVHINASVDPALIGGLVVKLGSRMIDNSIRTKLNSLKIALKEVG